MKFARWVFAICGLYGIVALAPLYFTETKLGQDYPPALNHPEFFYACVGVALAWQIAFLIISIDPHRFRPIMLAGILEKLGYGVPAVILFLQGRSAAPVLFTGFVDLTMAVLFLVAYQRTAGQPVVAAAPARSGPLAPMS
jgi:hypothetical protein